MCNDKCKICRLRARVEVAINDADIKREFERIERNQKIIDLGEKLEAIDYLRAKQAKTPSVRADGV
ncbi:hypothetical protein Q6344_04560 [Psychrobacter cibarius]|nr:hypothetical protein Q6344_04560 [Psychrobacter cibarius]